jgi:hypothetical protein
MTQTPSETILVRRFDGPPRCSASAQTAVDKSGRNRAAQNETTWPKGHSHRFAANPALPHGGIWAEGLSRSKSAIPSLAVANKLWWMIRPSVIRNNCNAPPFEVVAGNIRGHHSRQNGRAQASEQPCR